MITKEQSKTALITGISGQDGYYLSELLLNKGYDVYGLDIHFDEDIKKRLGVLRTNEMGCLETYTLDLADKDGVFDLIKTIQPDEIYNLGAQTHVGESFDAPYETGQVNALGVLNILDAIRLQDLGDKTKFVQASTSELFGNSTEEFQSETSPFNPCSPYTVAKLYAYWIVVNYRNAHGMFASNAIMFNHESILRKNNFVTRKITQGVAKISNGEAHVLKLGNLDAARDWGHARDYVYGMWKILNHDRADDFVLATGRSQTVRWFVEKSFETIGIDIQWFGSGVNEIGINSKTNETIVAIDNNYFRPVDVQCLRGNADKAKRLLRWSSRITVEDIVKEMVLNDCQLIASKNEFDHSEAAE